jgi:predicted Zn-dependent peptidase
MALGFFVRAGARDETPEVHGVSHFLEHMTFKGTFHRSAAEINRTLDDIGSHANAYTSEEQTVYYAAFVPDYQDQAAELLCDMMRPALRKEDFDIEKKVIVEEIHKYDDQPPFGAHEKCLAAFFAPHPLGNNVLGTVKSVTELTPEAMRGYFEERYSPTNMKLVAAGNFDFDRLLKTAACATRDWKPAKVSRDFPPAIGNVSRQVLLRKNAAQQYVVQISEGPASLDEIRFAHRLMTTIFGDECGSRLFWAFVDTGLAEFATSCPYEYEGAGITMTNLCCDPDDIATMLEELDGLQQQIESDGVTDDELEIARNKTCSQIVRRAERPANRLFTVGNNWLQRGIYRSVSEALKSYQDVTVDDVAIALQRFPLSRYSMVVAGPMDQLPN